MKLGCWSIKLIIEACLALCLHKFISVKALVGAFNKKKAFSAHCATLFYTDVRIVKLCWAAFYRDLKCG